MLRTIGPVNPTRAGPSLELISSYVGPASLLVLQEPLSDSPPINPHQDQKHQICLGSEQCELCSVGAYRAICSLECVSCSVQGAVFEVECSFCIVYYEVFSGYFALFSVQCVVCSV